MRHRVAHRKLGRVTEHRIAMLRNQATALLRHEHLTTTVPKAKELRPFVERLITIAKRGLADGATPVKTLNARRLVMQDLQDREVVTKLFDDLAPRFAARRAATRGCCGSASAAATPPSSRRSSSSAASSTRAPRPTPRPRKPKRQPSRRASAAACGPPPNGCAARKRRPPREKTASPKALEAGQRRTRARRSPPTNKLEAGDWGLAAGVKPGAHSWPWLAPVPASPEPRAPSLQPSLVPDSHRGAAEGAILRIAGKLQQYE